MRIPCVGAIVLDSAGRLLVIRRAHPPAAGRWSLPGGRVEPGETLAAAVRREVLEETGLQVQVTEVVGAVDLPGPEGDVYDVTDFRATVLGAASPVAGDDAAAVAWVDRAEFEALNSSPGLAEHLAEWGVWTNRQST